MTPARARRLVTCSLAALCACAVGEVQSVAADDTGQLGAGMEAPADGGSGEPARVPPDANGPADDNGAGATRPNEPLAAEPNAPGGSAAAPNATYALRWLGRVTADGNLASWPGPVVQVDFRGTRGSFALEAPVGSAAVALTLDGVAQPRLVVAREARLDFGPLPSGAHSVVLTKLSEAALGTLRVVGIETDGEAAATAAPPRRLLFLGDSITAGFGVDAVAPCSNTAGNENVTAAYASLVAKAVDAELTVLAWSGTGLLRNISDTLVVPPLTMAGYWRRQNALDADVPATADAASAPQVVVVALGTNDARYRATSAPARAPLDHAAFVAAYVALLRQLAAAYPEANFVLCGSPMLADAAASGPDALHANLRTDLAQVVAQVGPARARWVDVPTLPAGLRTACGGHPNHAGQQAMARMVEAAVRAQAGW